MVIALTPDALVVERAVRFDETVGALVALALGLGDVNRDGG